MENGKPVEQTAKDFDPMKVDQLQQIKICLGVSKNDLAKEYDQLQLSISNTDKDDFEVIRKHCPLISKLFTYYTKKERLLAKSMAFAECHEIIDQVEKLNEESNGKAKSGTS